MERNEWTVRALWADSCSEKRARREKEGKVKGSKRVPVAASYLSYQRYL